MCGAPKCDRESTHLLDLGDGSFLAACSLHWPQLVTMLRRQGAAVSDCLCCA